MLIYDATVDRVDTAPEAEPCIRGEQLAAGVATGDWLIVDLVVVGWHVCKPYNGSALYASSRSVNRVSICRTDQRVSDSVQAFRPIAGRQKSRLLVILILQVSVKTRQDITTHGL